MDVWDRRIEALLGREGAFSNDAADHGGATAWGITGLAQHIRDSVHDEDKLNALAASLESSAATLAVAVAANTEADAEPAPPQAEPAAPQAEPAPATAAGA